ncbi:MAG: hypothetical protein WC693_00305 [Patescibacteria group bacterium]|jgi:hypothetical protein
MKKIFYIFSFTVLGIILSFIIHAIIEYSYISLTEASKIHWHNSFGSGSCALPLWLQLVLLILGVASGLLMGFWGWRIVYIQKRHWKSKS